MSAVGNSIFPWIYLKSFFNFGHVADNVSSIRDLPRSSAKDLQSLQLWLAKEIPPCRENTIPKQRQHENAKSWLIRNISKIPGCSAKIANAKDVFSAACSSGLPHSFMLPPLVFRWAETFGVQKDIPSASLDGHQIHLFGLASQFNGAEAVGPFTPPPGEAVRASENDKTQGPAGMRTNPFVFELTNAAANIGFNALARVLSKDVAPESYQHGYLTPASPEQARIIARDFAANWQKAEQVCIRSQIPDGGVNPVYIMQGAAPALGKYVKYSPTGSEIQDLEKIQYFAALANYTIQFNQVFELAKAFPNQTIVYHPTAVGLGVWKNNPEAVGRAFRDAALQFQYRLNSKRVRNVQVQFEVFGPAKNQVGMTCVKVAGLEQGPRLSKSTSTQLTKFLQFRLM